MAAEGFGHLAGGGTEYGIVDTAFGRAVAAATEHGIRLAEYLFDDGDGVAESLVRSAFAGRGLKKAERDCAWLAVTREFLSCAEAPGAIALDPAGTPFQIMVWNAIRRIPRGSTSSYSDIARKIGAPDAARAVASACAANRIAAAVPCHRVIRSDGGGSGFRWGMERRLAMLDRERSTAG